VVTYGYPPGLTPRKNRAVQRRYVPSALATPQRTNLRRHSITSHFAYADTNLRADGALRRGPGTPIRLAGLVTGLVQTEANAIRDPSFWVRQMAR